MASNRAVAAARSASSSDAAEAVRFAISAVSARRRARRSDWFRSSTPRSDAATCPATATIRRRSSPSSLSGSYSCTDSTARQRPPSITGTATIDSHTSSLGHE